MASSRPESNQDVPAISDEDYDVKPIESDETKRPAEVQRSKSQRSVASSASSQPSFLSRFVSSFRPASGRPNLARSSSSPLVRGVSRTSPPATRSAPDGPSTSRALASDSPTSFVRPFFRRSTTAAANSSSDGRSTPPESPNTSPFSSPSPIISEREEDYLDAGGSMGVGLPPRRNKRGSITSQLTLLPTCKTSPALTSPTSIKQLPTTAPAPPLLDHPLTLINALLPPTLLLLSQLGPAHLFSPNHPSTSTAGRPSDPGFASISSTTAPTIDSEPTGHAPIYPRAPPFYSHELYAPSTISVPAISAAAVWHLLRAIEWIVEEGSTEADKMLINNDTDKDEERIFDFPSILQAVADILAAQAAISGVELLVDQAGRTSAPGSPPILDNRLDNLSDTQKGKAKAMETRELLVIGDDRSWVVALLWILNAIITSAPSGSTVDARFCASSNPQQLLNPKIVLTDSQETTVPTRDSLKKWHNVSIEFLLFTPVSSEPETTTSPLELPDFESPPAKSLLSLLDISLTPTSTRTSAAGNTYGWTLNVALPAPRLSVTGLGELPPRLDLSKSVEGVEPRVDELLFFIETVLKGMKVELRAGDTGTFAKHLATYLAGWGMDVTHISLDNLETDSPLSAATSPTAVDTSSYIAHKRETSGRFDAGLNAQATNGNGTPGPLSSSSLEQPYPLDFTSARPSSPRSSSAEQGPTSSASSSAGTDPTRPSNFVIIDDDVATLKRLLSLHRAPMSLNYVPTLLSKRPQLATRRTRSSTQIHRITSTSPPTIIILFASLTNYKQIRDTVQEALRTTRSATLPDVLVIPKPAGPRRIITALWTALRKPALDPSLPPIATSPSSPGVQYWSPRLSPALSNQQHFDFGGNESPSSKSELSTSGSIPRARTPPSYFPAPPISHPPSPLGKISDEQVSYFSCVAETMEGSSPSEGMVVQSPNGRPAIYFQPQPRGSRSGSGASGRKGRTDDVLETAQEDAEEDAPNSPRTVPTTPPVHRSAVSAPHEIGLGHGSRVASNTSSTSDPGSNGGSALSLDSYIIAAKSRVGSEGTTPEDVNFATPSPVSLHRQGSTASSSRSSNNNNTNPPNAARPVLNSLFSSSRIRNPSGPSLSPMAPRVDTPPFSNNVAGRSSPNPGTITSPVRRFSGQSGMGRSRRGTTTKRAPTLLSVPPINVLIVEDNPINQTILSMFMKKKGIKYAVANDGEEAVQKWKEGNFHLVLMDIQLPVKDGIEATRDIREMEREKNIGNFLTTPSSEAGSSVSSATSAATSPSAQSATSFSPLLVMPVIIVALTASSLQVDRVNALAAGCNDFLTKPVSLIWLQQKLLEWGSMVYLGNVDLAAKSPAFRAGLVANRGGDTTASRLRLPPVASKGVLQVGVTAPTLSVISASPIAASFSSSSQPSPRSSTALASSVPADGPDLGVVDKALVSLSLERPGLSPLTVPSIE